MLKVIAINTAEVNHSVCATIFAMIYSIRDIYLVETNSFIFLKLLLQ